MARRQIPWWQSAPLWVVINLAGFLVSMLPRSLELLIGPLLGRLGRFLLVKRVRIAKENIRRCLPELSPQRRRALLEENFAHFGILILEMLHHFSPIPGHYRRYCRKIAVLEGYDNYKKASEKGKGLLFVSSHVGNWEMLSAAGGLSAIPITIVTRRLNPPWLLKRLEASRLSAGVRAAYQPRTIPTVMRALKKGESVGFVIDQYASAPMGVPVNFFGAEVDTLAVVGPLARRTGAALVPVSTRRDAKGIVHVKIEPELDLGKDTEDQQKSTQVFASIVEKWIRETPAQWTWGHRRFKNAKWPEDRLKRNPRKIP